jgi:tetratricopeptide (TPR) repeat protein
MAVVRAGADRRPGMRKAPLMFRDPILNLRRLVQAAGPALALVFLPAMGHAVESDPLPVPEGGSRAQAIAAYNGGVKLMVERRFAEAQAKFEEALGLHEALPEAHNNLAFSLRMQGPDTFERALKHCNRALELQPRLARAYMYRGVLFVQMGDLARARADHARLLQLDRELAAKLAAAIDEPASRNEYEGLAPQFD